MIKLKQYIHELLGYCPCCKKYFKSPSLRLIGRYTQKYDKYYGTYKYCFTCIGCYEHIEDYWVDKLTSKCNNFEYYG